MPDMPYLPTDWIMGFKDRIRARLRRRVHKRPVLFATESGRSPSMQFKPKKTPTFSVKAAHVKPPVNTGKPLPSGSVKPLPKRGTKAIDKAPSVFSAASRLSMLARARTLSAKTLADHKGALNAHQRAFKRGLLRGKGHGPFDNTDNVVDYHMRMTNLHSDAIHKMEEARGIKRHPCFAASQPNRQSPHDLSHAASNAEGFARGVASAFHHVDADPARYGEFYREALRGAISAHIKAFKAHRQVDLLAHARHHYVKARSLHNELRGFENAEDGIKRQRGLK